MYFYGIYMTKKIKLLSELIITSTGQFIFFLSPFVLTKIYAVLLPKEEMGNLALWLISITALTILSSGPISQSVVRFTETAKNENDLYNLYLAAIYLFFKQIKLLILPLAFFIIYFCLFSINKVNILDLYLLI